MLNTKLYEVICEVIDRVKLDERHLDTDQYAGMIVNAINNHGLLPNPPPYLADAWERFRHGGGEVSESELRDLDEWRDECARDAGF